MKRLLLLLLAVLLLAGCSKKPPSTDGAETSSTEQDETVSLYVPNSSAEQQSAGAVRTYVLNKDSYFDVRSMGANLVVMGHKGLTVLSGERGDVIAELATEEIRAATVKDTAVTGMAYYLPNNRQVLVLNPQLQSVTQLELPKEIVGEPVICLARNEIYYSTGGEVRALHMDTGISRLLLQQTAVTVMLVDGYFDDAVLLCKLTDGAGAESLEYISAQTGQTLSHGANLSDLQTAGQQYVVRWKDGVLEKTVFGTRGEGAQCFNQPAPGENGGRVTMPAAGGVIDYVQTENGLELNFYDLNTGVRSAHAVLSDVSNPTGFYCDGTYIWMLASDRENNCLYRWDPSLSATDDATVYTAPLYTAQAPDTQGLAQCREQANEYEKLFGVKLLIWQDAVAQTGGHTVIPEHNTQIINTMLQQMQPVLSYFPEKFLLKTVEAGWIRIALVQSIEGSAGWTQFWEGGDCWILISAETDVTKALIQGLAYGIDSHVLGNSRDFDTWAQLNPEGFAYSYSDDAVKVDPAYLDGDSRAFADAVATRYPHEDRCRVFYHALQPDNAAMFASPVMQAKLMRLCTGIREAYSLEKKTVSYIWEQYLQTSLAYVPK